MNIKKYFSYLIDVEEDPRKGIVTINYCELRLIHDKNETVLFLANMSTLGKIDLDEKYFFPKDIIDSSTFYIILPVLYTYEVDKIVKTINIIVDENIVWEHGFNFVEPEYFVEPK